MTTQAEAKMKNIPLHDLDGICNCLAARKAARYLTAAYDRALAPSGLRITQFTILYRLARLGPTTIKRLAAAIAMDRTTLAVNLKPLERDSLLVSRAAEDRRAKTIEITAMGRAALERALPLWRSRRASSRPATAPLQRPAFAERLTACWRPDWIPGPSRRSVTVTPVVVKPGCLSLSQMQSVIICEIPCSGRKAE